MSEKKLFRVKCAHCGLDISLSAEDQTKAYHKFERRGWRMIQYVWFCNECVNDALTFVIAMRRVIDGGKHA